MLKKRINYEPESVGKLPLYCGHSQKWLGLFLGGQTSGFVKDYLTPAPSAEVIGKPQLDGRHLIILNRNGPSVTFQGANRPARQQGATNCSPDRRPSTPASAMTLTKISGPSAPHSISVSMSTARSLPTVSNPTTTETLARTSIRRTTGSCLRRLDDWCESIQYI